MGWEAVGTQEAEPRLGTWRPAPGRVRGEGSALPGLGGLGWLAARVRTCKSPPNSCANLVLKARALGGGAFRRW